MLEAPQQERPGYLTSGYVALAKRNYFVESFYASSLFKMWSEEEEAEWEKIAARGRVHFVFWHGVIRFGGAWCLLLITMMLLNDAIYNATWQRIVTLNLLIWSVAGWLQGELVWSATRLAYQRQLDKQSLHINNGG